MYILIRQVVTTHITTQNEIKTKVFVFHWSTSVVVVHAITSMSMSH